MNKRWGLLAVALALIAFGSALVLFLVPAPKTPLDTTASTTVTSAATTTDDLQVEPVTAASTSLTVSGKARGIWYFEASFPIQILNASGTVLAQGAAQAEGDWETTDFVAFTASFNYPAQPMGSNGSIVLKKDNPSGDPANDKQIEVPIVFN
jgi:hypothetical protein